MKTKLKIITVLAFAFFACVFLAPKSQTQTKVETAGQKFKSIKVLNDMPADQMGKVMNMMSASLGVNCNFCHTENDFAKEGFEHKDIARQMLKMTFELNKNYFEGRPEINCNTCHQGKAHPQASFPLKPIVQEERPKQPEKKPSVEEILAKYETALGGKANLAKITSRHIKANRIEPDGKTFEAEEIWQKGNKVLTVTTYPSKEYGDYVISELFDGKNGLKFGNQAKIELKPDEAEQIKREAQILRGDLKSIYKQMDFRVMDRIDGREVFLVNAVTADNQRDRLYFDVQTGLLVRRSSATPTILGNHVFQVDYQDYKDFGGVKLPTTIKYAMPQIYWTRKVLEVKNNVAIDNAKFVK
jgi:photosynthetic reaction center cytochrome c subunit